MNIVSSFDTIDSLSTYHNSQFSHSSLIKIDTSVFFYCWKNVHQFIDNIRMYKLGTLSYDQLTDLVNNDIASKFFNPLEDESTFSPISVANHHVELANEMSQLGEIYIYPYSKTVYRRAIHSNMSESLYKKYYKLLKQKSIVTQANGTYVEIRAGEFTEEDVKTLSSFQFDSSNIIAYIEALEDDKSYYSSMVLHLSSKIEELEKDLNNLSEQLFNKQLTTWA